MSIYHTAVAENRLNGFTHFLRNLGISSSSLSCTKRGGFYICRIDLRDVNSNVSEVWAKLSETQVQFLH